MDFVYPRLCVGCGREGSFLCERCFGELEIADQICPGCGGLSDYGWTHKICRRAERPDGLICLYAYEDEKVRKAIDELKFGFNREIVPLMLKGFSFESGIRFDAIVPIPLHFYRENWRGFNQAELIADKVGEGMSVGVEKYLVRKINTKQQASLRNREERESNMKGAFEAIKNLGGRNILLIDDVFTSGFSMLEAGAALKRAGAGTVWGLTLAH